MSAHTPYDLVAALLESTPRGVRVAGRTTLQTIPDPHTGQPLKVAAVESSSHGVCPACTQHGAGSYVSFVADLRLVFACASCQQLIWLAGA